MSFWRNMFTNGSGHAAAHNAHLAELTLPRIELESRLEIVRAMADLMRRGAQRYAGLQNHQISEEFDSFPRAVQLNFLALAMISINIPPYLNGESWLSLRTPIDSGMDERDIEVSRAYFQRKHHLDVTIGRDSLNLSAWLESGATR